MNLLKILFTNACNVSSRSSIKIVDHNISKYFGLTACRFFSSETETANDKPIDAIVESKFINRNPRNLEFLGIARKRKGWRFQYPTKNFYHRLIFERTNRQTTAHVEHSSGVRVVSASTRELAIMKHLYSPNDVATAENIGRVLAQRCRECGITSMLLQTGDNVEMSEKFEAFQKAMIEGGIDLSEPEEVSPEYEPGIDYDNPEEVSNLFERQQMVYNLGHKSVVNKFIRKKRKLRGRDRSQPEPKEPQMPAYTFT